MNVRIQAARYVSVAAVYPFSVGSVDYIVAEIANAHISGRFKSGEIRVDGASTTINLSRENATALRDMLTDALAEAEQEEAA